LWLWAIAVAAVGVHAIDIDLMTTNQILSEGDPPGLTVAATFATKGGAAGALETHTLLLEGEPAVRLLRVDGELNGKNAELTLVTASMPKPMRDWIKSFIAGKYKRRRVSLVTNTGNGPAPTNQPLYSRFDYKGVMIREVQFPALGRENGKFHIHLIYQSASETKNQPPAHMLDVPIRSQFFQFTMKGRDGKDKEGDRLGKSVYAMEEFSIGRMGGFGKQQSTTLIVTFPTTTDSAPKKEDGLLPRWQRWFGRDRKTQRHGKLTLYYWTGSSMDVGAEEARGQLKVLFELHLNDVSITKLDAGDGRATLSAGKVEMSDH